jgi:hypothetical protein
MGNIINNPEANIILSRKFDERVEKVKKKKENKGGEYGYPS